jgi:metal-responsive CopG/Arc/MetJ family transcriptional regulator
MVWYNGGMKVKTSVTLSEELLKAIEAQARAEAANRSALIEQAMWEYLRSRHRADRDREEMARINAASVELNKEALDTIDYQAEE